MAICRKFGVEPKVHLSVIERIALGAEGYAPGNLAPDVEVVADDPNLDTSGVRIEIRKAFAAGQHLAEFLRTPLIVLGSLLLTYALCYVAERKLRRVHSGFWFKVREDLRAAPLDGEGVKAARA